MSYLFALAMYALTLIVFAKGTAGRPSRIGSRHAQPRNAAWNLTVAYTPQDLKMWNYYSAADPTHGRVKYLDQKQAELAGLTQVVNGTFEMGVDDTTSLPLDAPRNSVRISSPDNFNGGLFVADILFMPYGCSVWPAYWSVGPKWPNGGEIDLIEGVNEAATNQITVHTSQGCTMTPMSVKPQGTPLGTECASSGSNNAGCAYSDGNTQSYGKGFNEAGGGVFIHLWDSTGIRMWFFPRGQIPQDITAGTPDSSTWGPPIASFGSGSCDMSHFHDHVLTFDITLCGDWAEAAYGNGCPGTCASAVMDPTNFQTAKWGVKSIKVYN